MALKLKIIIFVLLAIFAGNLYAQESNVRPFVTLGFGTVDLRFSANGLSGPSTLIDEVSFGGGCNVLIKEPLSVNIWSEIAIGGGESEYDEDFQTMAWMKIITVAFSLNVAPRYSFMFDNGNALFFELVGKLETSSSKAHFQFREKEDYNSSAAGSPIQFHYGGGCGLYFCF